MFLDEARIAAQLNHPNICRSSSLASTRTPTTWPWSTCPASTLALARSSASASAASGCRRRSRAGSSRDAASGLHYAHELTRRRRPAARHRPPRRHARTTCSSRFDGAVKLDRLRHRQGGATRSHTAPGMLKGKFAYMSPEQADGEPSIARSDIFSLGLVLRELLTGQRTLQRDSIPARSGPPVRPIAPPSTLNSACPADLDAVVMRALARRPEDRYATARQFALALEDWLLQSQQPASPGPPRGVPAHRLSRSQGALPSALQRPHAGDRARGDPRSDAFGPQPATLRAHPHLLTPERAVTLRPPSPRRTPLHRPSTAARSCPQGATARDLRGVGAGARGWRVSSWSPAQALRARHQPVAAPAPRHAPQAEDHHRAPGSRRLHREAHPPGKTPFEGSFQHGTSLDLTLRGQG